VRALDALTLYNPLTFFSNLVRFLNLVHPQTLPGIGKDGNTDMNVVRRTA
jgi:inhibitor of KinA sporulation pathway (predicted exonuclease)